MYWGFIDAGCGEKGSFNGDLVRKLESWWFHFWDVEKRAAPKSDLVGKLESWFLSYT